MIVHDDRRADGVSEALHSPHAMKTTKKHLRDFGYTDGCKGCTAARTGGPQRLHTEACRRRIEQVVEDSGDSWGRLKESSERLAEHDAKIVEKGIRAGDRRRKLDEIKAYIEDLVESSDIKTMSYPMLKRSVAAKFDVGVSMDHDEAITKYTLGCRFWWPLSWRSWGSKNRAHCHCSLWYWLLHAKRI